MIDLPRIRQLLDDVDWKPDERALLDAALRELQAAQERTRPTLQTLFGTHQPPPAEDLALHFVVPRPPAAKNSRRIYRTGPTCPACRKGSGHLGSSMSDEARKAVDDVKVQAIDALRRQAPHAYEERRPLLLDDDVRLEIVHNVHADTVDVLARRAGPCPKGTTGRKRDVVNVPELICDALQGIAFKNDNQVVDLRCFRNLGPNTHGEQ